MPDILPPQLVGVQQRPLYVKVRTALTVISAIWLLMAITGFGFFSGGTTSLALSLVLLYGTGTALMVVIAAVYRLVKTSAVKRTETAPDDTAAVVFVDTARSATEELLAALRPAAATGRPSAVSPRTVRAAVSEAPASATSAASATSTAKPSGDKASGAKAAEAKVSEAKVSGSKLQAQKQQAQKQLTKGAAAATAGKASAAAQHVSATHQKTGPAKSAPKSALNKAVPNKKAAGKSAPGKTAPGKSAPAKPGAGKAGVKSAQRTKASAKTAQSGASPAKNRPANNSGSVSTPAKRTGSSLDRQPGKKQPETKEKSAGSVGPGEQGCSAPQKQKLFRPALVLASSNAMPQPRQQQHIPDSRKRAS